jgi:RHS repeat-associated protein
VSRADAIDARPASRQVLRGAEVLDAREFTWGRDGRLAGDGRRRWAYDEVGRLSAVGEGDRSWSYEYGPDDRRRHQPEHVRDDRGRARACGGRVFRFNDRDELIEVVREGVPVVRFEYDHKSRVAAACGVRGIRRYVYGPSDELLAIVDGQGRPVRLYVPTPFGPVATVEFSAPPADADGHGEASPVFLHLDDRGTSVLATDATGQVVARCEYDPFGMPLAPDADERHLFHGRPWSPEAGLYYFGARWFDPSLGEFLTRDSWTARPDDYRLVNAVVPASGQRAARAWMLGDWLRHPRSRNPWAFCGHDPVGYSDPNGHWSFGGVLLSVLGAIWTLPNTLLGILIEITCLIGEVVRWLVWLVTGGNVSWATPGFDVAASGRLNAFALVFRGGWLGSFKSLLGITFGNVFFVYHDWENHPEIAAGGTVSPSAYGGTVTFPRSEALYEHELRHTNQYAWFGPFYHLGLPIWGVYLWDIIFNGYENSWCERDARAHAF